MARLVAWVLLALLLAAAPAGAQDHCIVGSALSPCPYDEVRVLGGPGATRVHAPADLAVAPDGRVAVADSGARRALVLRPDGSHVLAVGGGEVWSTAVAFAPDGSLYVGEAGAIHRYGADGARLATVTAGLRLEGEAYAAPRDLAVDARGRVYGAVGRRVLVWDESGTLVRTVERAEEVYTVAADGDGRLFADRTSSAAVDQIGPEGGVVRTIAGSSTFALATDGTLLLLTESEVRAYDAQGQLTGAVPRPEGFAGEDLAASGERMYLADHQGDAVRAATRAGQALPALGTEPGTGLNEPAAAAAAPDGRLWVADHDNHRLVAFAADGAFAGVLRAYGDDQPLAVAFAAEELVVTTESGRVERLGTGGDLRAAWTVAGGTFLSGVGISPAGDIWVRNRADMLRFSRDGAELSRFSVTYSQPYFAGHGMTVGPDGNLYVADDYAVLRYGPGGELQARLKVDLPEGIAVDPAGQVHVAAQRGYHLLSPAGSPLMRWGEYDTAAGRVHLPWGVAVDERRHIFVVDRWGQQVFRFRLREPGQPVPPAPVPPPPVTPASPRPVLAAATTVTTARAVRASVTCAAACRGTLRLVPAKGRGAYSRPVKFRLAGGHSKKLTLKLTRSARRALQRRRRLKAAIVATVGGTRAARRAVTVRYRR